MQKKNPKVFLVHICGMKIEQNIKATWHIVLVSENEIFIRKKNNAPDTFLV